MKSNDRDWFENMFAVNGMNSSNYNINFNFSGVVSW